MLASGNSSLAIWTPFDSVSTATIRPLKARCLIAWTRQQKTTGFAIIGTSKIGSADIVQGVGDNVLNDADLYEYYDETSRIISLEYERHLIEPLGGSAIGVANITLDNTDLRFTPDYNSTIGTAIRPNRPIKIFMGFEVSGQEVTVPIIEALSQQPKEDKLKRTVTIQADDFITFLDGIPQETSVYQRQRTDQIIADILSRAGIGSSNYQLDQGMNTPSFVGFGVGDFAGQSIQKLCEAEEGIFYQDESGMYRFENRLKFSQYPYNQPVWTIEPDDVIEWITQSSSQVINHIIVSGKPRSVKGEVEVWRDGQEEVIPANSTIVVWAQFNDPVTTLAAAESIFDYKASDQTGGAGIDMTADVNVTVTTFTNTALITINNTNVTKTAYLWYLKLRGTPATVDYEISEVYENSGSVSTYNQQQATVENDFIQSSSFAQKMAQDIVSRYKDPNNVLQLKIRGIPQLQLRDMIRIKDPDLNTYTKYRLIGIQGVFEPGSFMQTLTLRAVGNNELTTIQATEPTAIINENWQSGTISSAKWNNYAGIQGVVINQKLQITSNLAGGTFGMDTRINSHTYFDLTGSFVSNQLVDAGNQSLASFTIYPVSIIFNPDITKYKLLFAVQGNIVTMYKVVNNVQTSLGTFAYNAINHRYFRIRENGGTIYFETSDTSINWIIQASLKNPFNVTQANSGMLIVSTVEASTTSAIFDNFNITQ